MEHIDISAAADMLRAEFEAHLTGWVRDLLVKTRIQLNSAEQRELIEALLADMFGLGPPNPCSQTRQVSDIVLNRLKQVFVERRGKLEFSDLQFREDRHLSSTGTKIVTRVGRRVDGSAPLVDARLPNGSRVNVIVAPCYAGSVSLVGVRR